MKGEIILPLEPFSALPPPPAPFSCSPLVPRLAVGLGVVHSLFHIPLCPLPTLPTVCSPLGNVTLLSRLFTDKILLQAWGRVFCVVFAFFFFFLCDWIPQKLNYSKGVGGLVGTLCSVWEQAACSHLPWPAQGC